MTEEERLLNDTWPLIRETVGRVLPTLDALGWGEHVRSMGMVRQMEFWRGWVAMDDQPMPELTAVAREAMRCVDG